VKYKYVKCIGEDMNQTSELNIFYPSCITYHLFMFMNTGSVSKTAYNLT